ACSLPFQRRVPVWFYNRELLFKLNQETDRIPTNWSKLSTISQRLYKQGELWGVAIPQTGDGAIVRWTALGLSPQISAESLSDWVLKLWEAPGVWLPGNPSSEETTRLFLEQRAVIMLGTLDQAPFLRSNASFRIGSSLPDGDLAWFGSDFVVLSKGPGAALAREFLDYLYKPEVSLALFKAASTLPVTRFQSESALWKKEMEGWPLLKTVLSRKLKPLGLDKIAPQSREELATTVWEAIEQVPELAQRQGKLSELRTRLQKKLSINSH
ncbi:MAG: extracellular solute-binding protein, partial [Deltaproteobacteria bacterium]|nr:extracellular solute-binding protein [Deltaproteobacteria bacterium]